MSVSSAKELYNGQAERDRVAVGKESSHGRHGGNRAGDQHQDDRPQQSSRAAGKDPHRGGRSAGGRPKPS